ncbi:GNAT domain-containing protein, partial [Aspergillus californicus]
MTIPAPSQQQQHQDNRSNDFQTARLSFKPSSVSDAPALHELRTEGEVMKWSRQKRPDNDIAETEAWIRKVRSGFTSPETETTTTTEPGLESDKTPSPLTGCSFSVRNLNTHTNGEDASIDKIIGTIGISAHKSEITGKNRCEIGYMFVPRVWGQGYASEAVKGLVGWWFDALKESKIQGQGQKEVALDGCEEGVYAVVAKSNLGSLRVMEKCGFSVVGEGVDDEGDGILEFCILNSGKL